MEFLGVFVLTISFLLFIGLGTPIAWSINLIFFIIICKLSIITATTIAQRMATALDSFALLAIPSLFLPVN